MIKLIGLRVEEEKKIVKIEIMTIKEQPNILFKGWDALL